MNTQKAQHTAGEWKISRHSTVFEKFIEARPGEVVAEVIQYDRDQEEIDRNEANARLIAASPDLLAACEAALASCIWTSGEDCLKSQITTAINKAKGQQTRHIGNFRL